MIDMRATCAEVADLVEAVRDEQLAMPTPCAEYAVADLLAHLAEVAAGFGGQAGGAGPFDDAGRRGLADQVRALAVVWADPAAWEGHGDGAGLDLPNEVWGRIAFTEVLVHGWDLAQATGAPFAPTDDALRHCHDHVAEFVPAAPLPELWGTPGAAAADAPVLDRILAITGRTP